VAQLVSASPCHGEGRGFESRQGRQHGEALAAFWPGSSVGMSVRLKSGRSAVRSRPWPPPSVQLVGLDAALDTIRDQIFGPFMRPIYGQVGDWPYDGRSLAASRPRTPRAVFHASACQAMTTRDRSPTTSQTARTRSCGPGRVLLRGRDPGADMADRRRRRPHRGSGRPGWARS
jgi:hypothetical protein